MATVVNLSNGSSVDIRGEAKGNVDEASLSL